MTYEEALQLPDLTPEERKSLHSGITPLYENQPEAAPCAVGYDYTQGGIRMLGVERPLAGRVTPFSVELPHGKGLDAWKVGLAFKGMSEPRTFTFLDKSDADQFASTMVFGSPTP